MGCACGIERHTLSNRYILGSWLGHGSFAEVRVAHKRDSTEKFAIKLIRAGKEKGELEDRALDDIRNEAVLLSQVQGHPNCLKMLESVNENRTSYIVMELCGRSLLQDMNAKPIFIDNSFVFILKQMLAAISHCHAQRIVHRDVKPENFMFGGKGSKTLKLCDFSLACAIPKEGHLTRMCGTAPYMAPEMVSQKPYTPTIDVWSVGVVSYLMSFRHFPYLPKEAGSEAMKAVIRDGTPAPFFTVDERGAFLQKLMERSEQDRCSALEALRSEFFQAKQHVNDI